MFSNKSPPRQRRPTASRTQPTSSHRGDTKQQQRHQSRTTNRNQRKSSKCSKPMTPKQQFIAFSTTLIGMALWYLTPVSDFLVDIMLMQVPIEADMELGLQALKDLKTRQKTVHDPKWTPKLKSIGTVLVERASEHPQYRDAQEYQWDFGILQDAKVVNAFALPGGAIRVTSALLERLDLTDAELAALVGHEMGHVLHRHSQARMLSKQLLTTVMKALVYEDDDPHQESFGEAIGELLLTSADWLGQQSFSRSNEYEADGTSWDLLLDSHGQYNPKAMESLLTKLWDFNGKQGGETSWESTHPGTLDRIAALADRWDELPYSQRRRLMNG